MSFLLMYPAITLLTFFVLMVILIMLKYGSIWCSLRHTTYSDAGWQGLDFNNKQVSNV
ncbi:hypothetical protein K1T71_000491 [Dendrolimus kikuchii]|uniref:Uncharacterized protein n=1 Tax=Dendrolimus kikuchii TaxID=765133 RepID=A0ACC1DJE1_9NEOP|nr:hypothetical protein K1T71_000491 [Dendrolimus kikuchii]